MTKPKPSQANVTSEDNLKWKITAKNLNKYGEPTNYYFCIHHIPPDEWTGGQICLASVSLWVYWNTFCKYFPFYLFIY